MQYRKKYGKRRDHGWPQEGRPELCLAQSSDQERAFPRTALGVFYALARAVDLAVYWTSSFECCLRPR
jgi:hypothetical protein